MEASLSLLAAPLGADHKSADGVMRNTMMRDGNRTPMGAVIGLAISMVATPCHAAVYDLADFPFTFFGATELQATLETSLTGTFTAEADIESFFNSATYSVVLKNGATTIMELNNSNSSWDLQFGALFPGTEGSATLTSTPGGISLDFATPNEVTDVALVLGAPPSLLQYRQGNNVSDFNFVNANHDAVFQASANLPYDDPFHFPARTAVPEPSHLLVLGTVLAGLAARPRHRG